MSQQAEVHTVEETRELHERYMAAWAAHDVDAIAAFHAEDDSAHVHASGRVEQLGREAICENWQKTLTTWPDISYEVVRLDVARGVVVDEMIMRATLAVPFARARRRDPGPQGHGGRGGRHHEMAERQAHPQGHLLRHGDGDGAVVRERLTPSRAWVRLEAGRRQ
jgi:hypothetical protein